jgi:glutaconate CoA-transferase subunit B
MSPSERYLQGYTIEELLAVAIAKEIRDGEFTAVGTLSPIPASAAYLAKETTAPKAKIAILGGEPWPFIGGSKEFFDLAQRGKLDLFFLSGAQIDQYANVNLTAIGSYEHPRVRLPGAAGSPMLYYMAKRVMLFKLEHTPRTLVPEVDFKTSVATSPPNVLRLGGPAKLMTSLCVFAFDKERRRLVLESVHPGVSIEEVAAATGFPIEPSGPVGETMAPTAEELRILRTTVRQRLAPVYPDFAATALRPPEPDGTAGPRRDRSFDVAG